ncbi:sugar phosphate isomerase/epimerase family protein [Streptomyces sp. NPDC048254]|uniref:sugar phosphate isomerase/epimerase family protein n=1 Tax=Streptomyces sp. NPDC048254 TaxID=3365525 RepID=UPI0037207243
MTRELTASFVTLSGAGFAQPARVPFAERCRAAAAAGFTGIGLHTDDYRLMRADGASDASLRAVLGTHGLALNEIEFLSGWATAGTGGADTVAVVGALGEAFRPHHVTAGEFTADDLDIDAAGARLRTICDDVAAYGLRVAVEAFPWSGLKDVATARAVVEASGAANAGLMIDVWHFYNSRSSLADLDGLPPDRIVAVQLNDGRVVDGDFLIEARQGRLLPGDGELDVQGLLLGLHERGFRGPYCVEVNYPGYRDLPVDEMAAQAFTTASKALEALPAH